MNELLPLTADQYSLVMNVLNLSIALLGGFSWLFMLLRRSVAHNYSLSVAMMSAVTGMAAYHYFRLYTNWLAAYQLQGAEYIPTLVPFNVAYRYADWLGTVPLLLSAILLVLDVGRQKSASLVLRMVVSAVLMIGFGYVGEMQHDDLVARALWGAASTVPFVYILFVLWRELNQVLVFESGRVRQLFFTLRWVLLTSWLFYPVVYALPIFGVKTASLLTVIQVGNSAADLLAKVGIGLMIYAVAREKTEEDRALRSQPEKEIQATGALQAAD